MSGRRLTPAALAALVATSAVAGGAVSLAIGKATGWLGEGDTVRFEAAGGGSPPATTDAETPAAVTPRGEGAFDPAAIYRERSPGVVTIYALFAGHDEGDATAQAQGSGFVVSPGGYILTNSHVITTSGEGQAPDGIADPATDVYVEFRDGDRVSASIVGWDLFTDIGVVKVDPNDHRLTSVPLGDSSVVVVGEPVAAIGSPFGQQSSLAVGVVSATERAVDSLTSAYSVIDVIQTDAPINRGNSGGPLFNARGEVIGINAQIRSDSGNAEGVGFAIPINSARRSMEQLIESGRVRYAWVGIATQTVTASLARELDLPIDGGAAIENVVEGSPAENAGLRAGTQATVIEGVELTTGGDVVLAINGKKVSSTKDLIRLVAGRLFPGDTAEFTVLRDGERITVSVILADRPANPDAGR